MNTRNKFGYCDWHINIVLFNMALRNPNRDWWIYFLTFSNDGGEGRSLFKYIKDSDFGADEYCICFDLFWISFTFEREPESKYPWIECHSDRWAQTMCNHLWNRWVHKERWR